LQAIEKIITTNSWITALILLLFISIVILKALDTNRLRGNIFSLFNVNFVESEVEENSNFLDAFQIVIFIFTVIVLSLLTYRFKTYSSPSIIISFSSYVPVFFYLLSYFLIKRTLEFILIHLLLIRKEMRFFTVSKLNYIHNVAFLLYIGIVLNEYTSFKQVYLFYFAALLFIVRFVIHLVNNKNLIFNKLFYFILYICAFEIAPLFLLFKMMF
jgi:hypothetical protein